MAGISSQPLSGVSLSTTGTWGGTASTDGQAQVTGTTGLPSPAQNTPVPSSPSTTTSSVQGTNTQTPPQEKLKAALADLQSKVQSAAPDLQLSFSVDKDTDRPVVKVVDARTNEVIRQIPSKEILQLDKDIDKLQGLLLDKQA